MRSLEPKSATGLPAMCFLGAMDLERLMDWPGMLDVVTAALSTADGTSGGIQVPAGAGAVHVKYAATAKRLCIKANLRGVVAGRVTGGLILFDLDQAAPVAFLESASFTAIRTAAVAAAAARLLAPRTAVRVAVLGLGPLGRRCLEALPHVVDVAHWNVWNRTPVDRSSLVAAAPLTLHASASDAAAGCHLVVTCTSATVPILRASDLRPSAIVLAMGADTPGKQELARDIVATSDLVIDDYEALTRGESAHLIAPHRAVATVADIVAGAADVTTGAGKTTVFDSVGSAMVDAYMSTWFVEQAQRRGVGSLRDITGSLTSR